MKTNCFHRASISFKIQLTSREENQLKGKNKPMNLDSLLEIVDRQLIESQNRPLNSLLITL